MSRSNEELVALIQGGAKEYIPDLWEQIVGLVKWRARYEMTLWHGYGGVEYDDLINAGYIAMFAAVESYDPSSGCKFSTWLMYYLKNACAETIGYRTKREKNDPINVAASLNAPLGDDSDDGEFGDVVADPNGEKPIDGFIDSTWNTQLHEALEAALTDLPDDMAEIMRAKFWNGASRDEIATAKGVTPEKVRSLEGQAIRTLRKPEHACKLIDFYDFSYYSGTGLTTFQHTGASIQERFLLIQEERRERARKRSEAV